MTARRWLALAAVTLLAGAFAFLNRGEMVPLRLGVATLYRAPLAVVVFAAFLLGMLSMLAVSLRQDLRTRRILRQHGLLDPRAETPRAAVHPPVRGGYDRPDHASPDPRPPVARDGTSSHDQPSV